MTSSNFGPINQQNEGKEYDSIYNEEMPTLDRLRGSVYGHGYHGMYSNHGYFNQYEYERDISQPINNQLSMQTASVDSPYAVTAQYYPSPQYLSPPTYTQYDSRIHQQHQHYDYPINQYYHDRPTTPYPSQSYNSSTNNLAPNSNNNYSNSYNSNNINININQSVQSQLGFY